MKRANGTGSVIKHGGNRRRPFEARITAGRDPQGRQTCRSVGWYATRDEAMAALIAYNQSPYDIDSRTITTAALYARWYARAVEQARLAPATLANLRSAYTHCADIADTPYTSLRAHHMQLIIDGCGNKAGAQATVKSLFYHLDKYAMELDIISKTYSMLLHTTAYSAPRKSIFSDAEVARLWNNVSTPNAAPYTDTVLILLYSGWRVSELLKLTKENIYIDDTGKTVNTMRGGIKTKAGKDRIIPIYSAILPLVRARYNSGEKYLVENSRGRPLEYHTYRAYYNKVMEIISAKHTVHETRHTFRSWMDSANAPISCVNKIMGHVCNDVGLQTYTHKTIEQLAAAIEMITVHC